MNLHLNLIAYDARANRNPRAMSSERDSNGDRELHKVGEMSTNEKQVPSGIIDSFTKSILSNTPPEIDGMEGYKSLDVILTAMDAGHQGRILKIGAGTASR